MSSHSGHVPAMPLREVAVNGTDSASSTVRFTRRTERSQFMHLLQSTLRLLRPRLVTPPKNSWPPGSVRMKPPSSIEKKYKVEERKRQGVWTYEITPKSLPTDAPKADYHVYYFAGCSFQNVPSGSHWKAVAAISNRIAEKGQVAGRIHLVSPPLAPKSPAKDSLRILRSWIEDVLQEAHREGWTITLAGDSSGGNLAATLAIGICGGWPSSSDWNDTGNTDLNGVVSLNGDDDDHSSREANGNRCSTDNPEDLLCMQRSPFASALTHILLICPVVDMSNTNPRIANVGAVDPLLTPNYTGDVADCWRGTSDTTSNPSNRLKTHMESTPKDHEKLPPRAMKASDPRVSPLMADLSVLKRVNITVDGLIAGLDSLSPDAEKFVEKLQEHDIDGDWQLWEQMMHCWVLMFWAGLKDASTSFDWVVDRFQQVAIKNKA